jgi:hypothetical protein
MNEYFAVADVPPHQWLIRRTTSAPAPGNASKDPRHAQAPAMISMDARDASDADWRVFAQGGEPRKWQTGRQLRGVMCPACAVGRAVVVAPAAATFCQRQPAPGRERLPGSAPSRRHRPRAPTRPSATAATASWAQVCAPSVAVAMLLDMELR